MFTDFVKSTKYIQFVLLLFVKFLVKSYAFFVIFFFNSVLSVFANVFILEASSDLPLLCAIQLICNQTVPLVHHSKAKKSFLSFHCLKG